MKIASTLASSVAQLQQISKVKELVLKMHIHLTFTPGVLLWTSYKNVKDS